MTELSRYIKTKRKEFSLTQIDLSHKSGVGLYFVRELEQCKETLRMDKVNQVLRLFDDEPAPRKIQSSLTQQQKWQLQSLVGRMASGLGEDTYNFIIRQSISHKNYVTLYFKNV